MDMIIPFSSALVRRKCLIEVGLFDERRRAADDYDLWLRIGRLYEIDYVDEVFLEYRAESEGSIGSRPGQLVSNHGGDPERVRSEILQRQLPQSTSRGRRDGKSLLRPGRFSPRSWSSRPCPGHLSECTAA